jgi:hypothetical protein
MNEDQVTALLDRLASRVEACPARVDEVTLAGARRRRWRRGAHVCGAAILVLGLAGGGLFIQGQVSHDRLSTPATQPTGHTQQLLHRWRAVELGGRHLTAARPGVHLPLNLTFSRSAHGIIWNATDGCMAWTGRTRVGVDWSFSSWDESSTLDGCGYGAGNGFTVIDAVTRATRITLSGDQRLTFYDAVGRQLGVFLLFPYQTAPGPGSMPGRVPTEADLLGGWRPALLGQGRWASVPHLYPGQWLAFDHSSGGLRWHGEDGCNSVAGRARLGATGTFSTSGFSTTLVACGEPGGRPPYTETNVMLHATQVRLVDHRLAFYRGDMRLGLFVRGK